MEDSYYSDTPTLQVKTTPGVGDFMYPLNRALYTSHGSGQKFHVEFHWQHSENHLHHFEDPETIIERFNYVLPFYHDYERLTYGHVFDSQMSERLIRKRLVPNKAMRTLDGIDSMSKVVNDAAYWKFVPSPLQTIKEKVVIWRPLFNAEVPPAWKTVVDDDMWTKVIDILNYSGFDIVELSYRTPISEVHYHIATCDFIVCYDGMWHYFAKNYYKPMIVTSRSNITKLHTPQALMLHDGKIIKGKPTGRYILEQLPKMFTPSSEYGNTSLYEFIHKKARKYEKKFNHWYKVHANR